VKQLYVSNCEGDDVIAYLCDGPLRQEEKIILSTDKDMYQLMNDKTRIYNLYTKKLMSYHDIVDQYLITASNFGIAKAICGDVSDNISGIKGVGFKTLAKHIDVLRTHEDLSLKDVFSYCYSHRDISKVCNKIIESKEIVERNWALIHLDVSSLSASQAKKIEYQINQPAPIGNKIDLMKELIKEGINNFDVSHVFSSLTLARAMAENEKKDLDDKNI
jgi:DNA polymerase-1